MAGCDVGAYERVVGVSEEEATPQLSLLDALPLFVEVVARARDVYGEKMAPRWRAVMGRFMLAAVGEGYLVCGAEGAGLLREAFAWGPEDGEEEGEGMWGKGWEEERAEGVRMVS